MWCMLLSSQAPDVVFSRHFRHLIKNLSWLEEKLDDYADDDYVLFDCPGMMILSSL